MKYGLEFFLVFYFMGNVVLFLEGAEGETVLFLVLKYQHEVLYSVFPSNASI